MQETEDEGQFDKRFYQQFYNEEIYSVNEVEGRAAMQSPEPVSGEGSVILLSGDKQSETLLLFSYPGKDSLPAKDKTLLDKILQAAVLSLDKVSWLNVAKYPDASWREILLVSQARRIISFGVPARYLPEDMKPGQLYSVQNRRMIATLSLPQLESDVAAKKVLWNALKEIYNL